MVDFRPGEEWNAHHLVCDVERYNRANVRIYDGRSSSLDCHTRNTRDYSLLINRDLLNRGHTELCRG